ncbi:MAG: nucleoside monophosphate kinase [Acidimicrobiia bacterium]
MSASAGTDWASDADLGRATRIVMLGRQGSGKGTQCERLAELFGVAHLSTGALFRDAVARDTKLGRSVKTLMEAGDLVTDELVLRVVAERLARADVRTHGFVLDGFPRTVEQAEALALLLGSQIDIAINLAVNPRVVLERLLRRRVCGDCGRAVQEPGGSDPARCPDCGGPLVRRDDDTRPAIARRLALFEQ